MRKAGDEPSAPKVYVLTESIWTRDVLLVDMCYDPRGCNHPNPQQFPAQSFPSISIQSQATTYSFIAQNAQLRKAHNVRSKTSGGRSHYRV